eukprot:TRINITY_DN6687_c0_g1_i2.p1 TRINITY_DN6687_c0_g1~~TRINITY_DN6687_c0_g1_i2.p1  ORF type:complete len:146 (+),score=13.97 TRINITY_DN6687_c0_g1_i2:3037-3474(+)
MMTMAYRLHLHLILTQITNTKACLVLAKKRKKKKNAIWFPSRSHTTPSIESDSTKITKQLREAKSSKENAKTAAESDSWYKVRFAHSVCMGCEGESICTCQFTGVSGNGIQMAGEWNFNSMGASYSLNQLLRACKMDGHQSDKTS